MTLIETDLIVRQQEEIAELEQQRDEWAERYRVKGNKLAEVTKQRDELVAAIEMIVVKDDCGCGYPCDCYSWATMSEIAKKALDRVKESK